MKSLQCVMAVAVLGLCGCGGADPGQEPEADAERNRALLDAAEQPLMRAREVEHISAARKGQLDEEIEGAEE